ncbi:MAG TPA: NAD-dependent succinate-semialdehyde dehydrogenase [Oligoflexia bacterium]|nr:NAD-dependent succinate-semialdehyde dehydrogenase [Oligoflexia bacterium]HMR24647.1 NAD-dependent succinate-semialdehyde dehydrogenase [Oligoflexia bacterium]
MKSINPLDGSIIKEYQEYSEQQVLEIIDRCHNEFFNWKQVNIDQRCQLLLKTKEQLLAEKNRLAHLMADEMGKRLVEGEAEIEKCAWLCEYYANNAKQFLKAISVQTDYNSSEIHFSPIGVVFAVMPWNYPFWQVFRFAVPNLVAGNVGVLKHASNVSACALEIEKIFRDSGFPEYCFKTLLMGSDKVETIIKNPKVRAVSLTGSTQAGKAIAQLAGQYLKKSVLELGGSDPYIILEDADLDLAVEKLSQSRLLNSGQSCIAAKRFIVIDKVHDDFVHKLKQQMSCKIMGSPKEPDVDLGPMARFDLRDELHEQVQASIQQGAKCILGGEVDSLSPGAFYPPTILINVKKGMKAYSEELFGPVASVIKVNSIEEAIEVANDSDFGLGAAIFSKDIEKAQIIAKNKIDSGACFVNDFVKSDPRLPFGGVKESGYGRELSQFGIHEFMNIKTVCVK